MTRLLLSLAAILAALSLSAARPALVSIPVTCMRSAPGHASEQCSQAILGSPLLIAETRGDWHRVSTPDGYSGWVRSNTIEPLSESEFALWKQSRRVVCRSWLTRLYDRQGNPDGYAPYGAILPFDTLATPAPGFVAILSPAGKPLQVDSADVWADTGDWTRSFLSADADTVIALARTMLGAPYLWGGTSSLAPDCSGFTQIAFSAAGMLLPRDTSMQIKCGVKVPSLDRALPGDLIFYGDNGRVNHVAIYLGGGKIIHSSGHVRVCRMSPGVEGSEELYTDTPLCIRRVLGVTSADPAEAAPAVPAITANHWYFPN